MRKELINACSWGVLALSLLSASGAAAAAVAENSATSTADAGNGVSEIIVTAQKRAEDIQSVPLSIVAVNASSLEKSGVNTLGGLQKLAPGLSMSAVGSGFVSYTYIRGGGTNQLDAGADPSVAFFVDEIYIAGTSGLQFDLFDIDHVEVLKGPQGTLFGRNAASGAISIVTKRPSAAPEGDLDIVGGDYGTFSARASLSGPLTSDGNLLYRFSAAYRRRDAFTTNLLPGHENPGAVSTGGARGQLEWRSGKVKVLLTADYSSARDGMTNQFLTGPSVAASVDPTLPQPTDQSFYRHYYNLDGFEHQDVYDVNGRVEWQTPIGQVTSISAYRLNKFSRVQDQDGTLYDAYELDSAERDRTFSQEVRLSGDSGRFHYLGGFYYFNGATTAHYRAAFGPAFATASVRSKALVDDFVLNTQSYAAFGQAGFDLTRQLNITVGGRYTVDDKRDAQNVNRYNLLAYTVDPQVRFNAFTPSVTLNYKPSEHLLAYFSYRQGFKSGGFQSLGATSAALANTPFRAEHVALYEAGLKATLFDRKLLADVDVFRSDITDQQISRTVITGTAPYPVLVDNAGQTRAQGIDLSLQARPTPALQLTANATYQHARFLQYTSGTTSFAGNTQLRSPDFMGYLSGEYTFRLGNDASLSLMADYSYRSRTFFDPANTRVAGLYQPAYGVGNLRATFRPKGERVEISAFVKNVGDTHYFENIAVSSLTGTGVPGEPRTFGGEIHFRY